MTSEEIQEKILDGIGKLDEASKAHIAACKALGPAEHAYRQARATADLYARTDGKEKKTEPHLKSIVDMATKSEMYAVRIAENDKEATFQLVLSVRHQISALQSLMRNNIEEARATTYGQTAGA
jgi:hypothetical protein